MTPSEIAHLFEEGLKGDSDTRQRFYTYCELHLLEQFEGQKGLELYSALIALAEKAGIPVVEVRNHLLPLMDQDLVAHHVKEFLKPPSS